MSRKIYGHRVCDRGHVLHVLCGTMHILEPPACVRAMRVKAGGQAGKLTALSYSTLPTRLPSRSDKMRDSVTLRRLQAEVLVAVSTSSKKSSSRAWALHTSRGNLSQDSSVCLDDEGA